MAEICRDGRKRVFFFFFVFFCRAQTWGGRGERVAGGLPGLSLKWQLTVAATPTVSWSRQKRETEGSGKEMNDGQHKDTLPDWTYAKLHFFFSFWLWTNTFSFLVVSWEFRVVNRTSTLIKTRCGALSIWIVILQYMNIYRTVPINDLLSSCLVFTHLYWHQ